MIEIIRELVERGRGRYQLGRHHEISPRGSGFLFEFDPAFPNPTVTAVTFQ